jgi:hypothetical protein
MLRSESHPFLFTDCQNGIIDMQFSCLNPVEQINPCIYKKDGNRWIEINRSIYSFCEIIQKSIPDSPERCRFIVHLAFPSVGLFKIEIYINGLEERNLYINNKIPCESIPFLNYNESDTKFIPITPKSSITNINNGFAIIRFAVLKKRSELVLNIFHLNDDCWESGTEISREFGEYVSLEIPYDKTRYEDIVTVTFPSNGKYLVYIYLKNDEGSFTSFISYYFNVANAREQAPISPLKFVSKGRKFPKIESPNININPSDSIILTSTNTFEISCEYQFGNELTFKVK